MLIPGVLRPEDPDVGRGRRRIGLVVKCTNFVAKLPGFKFLGKSLDFSVPQFPCLSHGLPVA